MGRRKLLLVIIIFGIMVLFVSPLATNAPMPADKPVAAPEKTQDPGEASPSSPPLTEDPAVLQVAAVADEDGMALLEQQSAKVSAVHPEIRVEWQRIDPGEADFAELSDELDGADIVLLPNEQVKPLAVAGSLLPVDSAYPGEALSEQFGVLLSQMKWNGYLWGVPRDFDPYVLVWNRNVLASARPDAPQSIPSGPAQWAEWPQKLAEKGVNASWLALDPSDPYALLAWIGEVTGKRQDEWLEPAEAGADAAWSSQSYEQALTLLSQQRGGIALASPGGTFWTAFAAGQYGAAVVRNSQAVKGLAELPASAASSLRIDRSAWETPFVWPNGESFVLSAWTGNEDAAMTWISEMTGRDQQSDMARETGRLPVYRSLYESGAGDLPDLSGAGAQRFPNQAPLSVAPDLPEKLRTLGTLLKQWTSGTPVFAEWKGQWATLLAKAENDG
ncbi:extracellular solute-binding protein [Cohnella zeiphila]|uniref:Extracellular solute-binding protein n=1 Tax=Cohnella zeiphila TaxID=2761120 RepID=A0A7X0SGS7_9BACL|nr:extracellular solute-binding protein [Cohnella zeiphila]MBB6729673.1 extracellular solute-binding protein [Cohnella zeiphila]